MSHGLFKKPQLFDVPRETVNQELGFSMLHVLDQFGAEKSDVEIVGQWSAVLSAASDQGFEEGR
jgi:hypothetical protein